MRWFGRALAWSISLLLITVGLLWPVIFGALPQAAGPASDPVVITNFRGDFVVDRDGRLEATETITTRFPSGRHGIFRYWDVANQNDSHIRQVPQVTEILLDDQPVPYKMLWQNQQRFLVAKIGDPDRYLDFGTHVFRIRYTIDGCSIRGREPRRPSPPRSATPRPRRRSSGTSSPGLEQRDRPRRHHGHAARRCARVQCSVGYGDGRPCADLAITGDRVELSATNLPPRTPVTLRAGVDVPTPPRAELPWSYRWDRVLGRSVQTVLWLLGLTVTAGLGAFLWWRTTVEPEPGFPLQYAPPRGSGRCNASTSRTEEVPARASPPRCSTSPTAGWSGSTRPRPRSGPSPPPGSRGVGGRRPGQRGCRLGAEGDLARRAVRRQRHGVRR